LGWTSTTRETPLLNGFKFRDAAMSVSGCVHSLSSFTAEVIMWMGRVDDSSEHHEQEASVAVSSKRKRTQRKLASWDEGVQANRTGRDLCCKYLKSDGVSNEAEGL